MIKPAICFKDEIEKALRSYFYTDDMMYYCGCNDSDLINVLDHSSNGDYQYAVTGKDDRLIGYIGFSVDYYSSCAYNLGAFSFDRGNPIMGKELFGIMEKMVERLHRVEFRAVEGNPAIKGYDKFLERHSDMGRKLVFRDAMKDTLGVYHDTYLYEFINPLR